MFRASDREREGRMGEKRNLRYLIGTLGLTLLVCGGCGKGEEAEGVTPPEAATPSEAAAPSEMVTPYETLTAAPTAVPETSATPGVATGTPVPTKPAATPTGEPPLTGEAKLPMVTPVPQDAVSDIAGSIAPEDFPVVDGSTATLPLSRALYQLATGADETEAENAIVHTKTTNSYYRLYDGEADLLIVYEPPQEVIDRMQKEELLVKPIGLDALVFMANAANPVQALTTKQLIDIYAGTIKNWAEVGGDDEPLLAFQRPAGSGSQTLMQKLVMGDTPMEEGDNVIRYQEMADILEGMLTYTGEDNTLGYSVFYYANFMYSLPELRFMGVDGVIPSTQTIYDGLYPFVNAFYAVIRPDEPEDSNARRLFDWLTGEAGQQLVLDLGYVPVIMPEGSEITEKEPDKAEELVLTPVNNLAPGEHYIFFRQQDSALYNLQGDLKIYDENWNCCASFQNVSCDTVGVTNKRYISILQWSTESMEKSEYGGYERHIYDLEKQEFVEFEGISTEITIRDGVKGYFQCRKDWNDADSTAKIIDRDGKVLTDEILDNGDWVMLYHDANYYRAYAWPEDLGDNTREIHKIFDSDFRLKSILYQAAEDMPAAENRREGVIYESVEGGCLLSPDGDVLLNAGRFLEVFGNGTDITCLIGDGDFMCYPSDNELYKVVYAGETWYVDRKLNVYIKEGEKKLTIRDAKEADALYYVAYMKEGTRYFAPDGGSLVIEPTGKEPEKVYSIGNESYLMVRELENGYEVTECVPAEDYYRTYQYTSAKSEYSPVEYCKKHVVALDSFFVGEDGKRRHQLTICRGEHVEQFTADEISFSQNTNWGTNTSENTWVVTMYNGDKLTLANEGIDRKIYTYALLTDGELRFMTTEPGELVSCYGGYMQVNIGNYTYVYDYDGNQIIKANNRLLLEE